MATSPVPKTIPVKRLTKLTDRHHPLVLKNGVLHIRTRGTTGTAVLTPLTGEEAADAALKQSSRTHLGRMFQPTR